MTETQDTDIDQIRPEKPPISLVERIEELEEKIDELQQQLEGLERDSREQQMYDEYGF